MSFSSYGNYKVTNVAGLGEVPAHWNVVPLKHVVETPITDGPHETPEFIDDGIPFVSAEAVSSGEINFSKSRFISHADHHKYSKKYKPRRDDIFMVKSGATTGVVALVSTDRDFNIWSPLAVVRCSRLAFPRYVLQTMRSRNFQESVILNWSFGTQQNIGMSVIENLRIPLPPISEQNQIARFLDHETARIDALIEEQQRLIELLKEKRQAVIFHAVTKGLDPTVPMKDSGAEWLGEVPAHWDVIPTNYRYEIQLGRMLNEQRAQGDHMKPYLRVFDVQWNAINTTDLPLMDFPPEVQSMYRLKSGDLMVNEGGSYVGRSAIWRGDLDECYYQKALHRLRARDAKSDTAEFFLHVMEMATLKGVFVAGGNLTTIDHLTAEQLRQYRFAFPPLKEQLQIAEKIAEVVSKIQNTTTQAEQLIGFLKERRSALISAAVTGKIDVRGWKPPVSAHSPELEEEAV